MLPSPFKFAMKDFPEDALSVIFTHLTITDVLSVRQVCKAFNIASRSKQVWLTLLHRDVHARGLIIPSYSRPLDSLSGSQVESLVTHAIRLRHKLLSQSVSCSPAVTTIHQTRSVTWIRLVLGQWLVAACSDQSTSVLRLWHLASLDGLKSSPDPVDEVFLEGPVAAGLLEVQGHSIIIALEIRAATTIIEVLSLQFSDDGRPGFVRLRQLREGVSRIRSLRGSQLGFAVHHELSIPSILDWQTGVVVNLRTNPDADGGAVAMASEGDTVAVITPQQLQVYKLQQSEDGSTAAKLVHTVPLGCFVGWALATFTQSSPPASPDTLRICICGTDGLFVHAFPLSLYRSDTPRAESSPLWDVEKCNPAEPRTWDPLLPIISAHGTTVAWFVRPRMDFLKSFAFATLLEGLPASPPSDGHSPIEPTYILEHPDLPALYAACVYDYDDALGVAAFGNAYGELAVLNLGASDITLLSTSFELLVTPDGVEEGASMPRDPIPATSALSFPHPGPWAPSQADAAPLFAYWQAHQPRHIPEGWQREGLPEQKVSSGFTWMNIIPRWPKSYHDIGWEVEYAYHYLGSLVPLIENFYFSLFTAGGLLLLWSRLEETMFAISPEVTFEDFIIRYAPGGGCDVSIASDRLSDFAAEQWGRAFYNMWVWEGQTLVRNRWQELKDRGGEVHDEWLSVPSEGEDKS